MATGTKRGLEESAGAPKAKKTRVEDKQKKDKPASSKPSAQASNLVQEDVDFPRGGGTSFTPLEVKAIRAEAVKEANEELFNAYTKEKKRTEKDTKGESVRIEHLNYKRITVGMRLFGQIISVEPLALIVSLPNQLLAHVPVTNVTTQLTQLLENVDEDVSMTSDESDDEGAGPSCKPRIPELFEIFHPGQYVRSVVTAVHATGSTDALGLWKARDDAHKASRRVELSLIPEKVNTGVVKADLKPGLTISAAVKSVEDHGYILDLGLEEVSGFLSFKDTGKAISTSGKRLQVGHLIDVSVLKLSSNGRICNLSSSEEILRNAVLSEVSNVKSVLPGELVQGLITTVQPTGLNLQILGFFTGTIDEFHLRSGLVEDNYKVGQKVKARILYDIDPAASTAPRFALSLADHVVSLTSKPAGDTEDNLQNSLQDAFPIGTIIEAVKVARVENERGLVVEVAQGVEGFVHISQTSDDHVPSLSPSSGPWKCGTIHRARVTGYYPLDGLLQLTLRPSILEQKFIQVGEVQVGEVIKGTVKKLTDSALFVSMSGNVDGVIWPTHYADIMLKHPQKRFKPGGSIKCRILVVDPERKRVVLTAKKTLLESTLPIISKLEDAKVGLVTHAVVFKTSEKSLQVEFFNNLKAIVPIREASETSLSSLSAIFPIGKTVQVRVISVDPETSRIVASIRQAAPNFQSTITAIQEVEIGNTVEGTVSEIQKDKIVVTLQPTQVRALLSLNNLANRRGITLSNLRTSLKLREKLSDLVVTSRNPEKGFVLVATKPKEKEAVLQKHGLSIDTVQPGQVVGGRILRHVRQGALVKLTARLSGLLHPTDTCDDYETGTPFPAVDSIIKASVVTVDRDKRQLTLSMRPSVMHPDQGKPVVDKIINELDDLVVGATVRGFIKSVAEHGLFVSLGRNIDARVQIKELFDEFVKDWKSHFTANQLVKGRVLRQVFLFHQTQSYSSFGSVNKEKKQVELSFRSSDSSGESTSLKLTDLAKGQKVDAIVQRIEDYGLFLEVEGSKIRGLCHKSELSDNKDADVSMALRSFREGDRVKAAVLSIDTVKRRISFGLKPSYFDEHDFTAIDGETEEDPGALGVIESAEVSSEEDASHNEEEEEVTSEDDDDEEEDVMQVDVPVSLNAQFKHHSKNVSSIPTLELGGGFQWSAQSSLEYNDISASSSDEDGKDSQVLKKRKKRRKEIEEDLTADLHTKAPESNADFERLLLGSPNSSYLWIQYMSFQLQLSEIDKARDIARRALRMINFREEQEKLNIWIALLNLENIYGTEESLETVFKDAARHNDSKTIHLRLAAILDQSGKLEKAEEQFKRTAKKFGQSSKIWTLFGEFYLRHGKPEEARSLLSRALQSLEKRKHLKTISKFAQFEYKFGDPERGKTIFEGIVDSHPKRWDLWSIYLDMEAGQEDMASVRNLFDRVLAQKMTSHKAKAFFKKWLELERRSGNEEGASAVKEKAIEWTQRAANSA
ncbi:nucleic acid-binding protein [Irpex rosettiformis]|uniref:Nucleic acid-binding protein n=1 Tax=Irpex rosettiformis TaxID=378272 RepID=A0ACB8UL43_9APHY|nr:nucleic acid-binding protein [Irpex rosettiformis]